MEVRIYNLTSSPRVFLERVRGILAHEAIDRRGLSSALQAQQAHYKALREGSWRRLRLEVFGRLCCKLLGTWPAAWEWSQLHVTS